MLFCWQTICYEGIHSYDVFAEKYGTLKELHRRCSWASTQTQPTSLAVWLDPETDMARVVGIDPGSISFDLCGWEQGRVFLDQSVPSDQVADRAESILEMITASGPVDLILGPSGYGLPVTDVQDIGERELFLMTLVEARERRDIPVLAGMEALINLARVRRLPLCFTPAVVHLPTVPRWRKINRIDLGTADKLNCAILAIYDQAHTYQIHYRDTALILVEVGGAFTSVIAVDQGQVVDGIGGSAGAAGFKMAVRWTVNWPIY